MFETEYVVIPNAAVRNDDTEIPGMGDGVR